jgi:acyl-CoA thioester hydrolase
MVATELRVIYGDTDQMGVVYYANYLRFFEAGRNEFIRARGLRYRDFEELFELRLPVAEVGVSYQQPARYDDLVRIEVSLHEVRRASARFGYRLVRADGELLATGHTVHACVDLDGRIRRLPRELLERLGGVEPAPESRRSRWQR